MPVSIPNPTEQSAHVRRASDISPDQYRYLLVLLLIVSIGLRFWNLGVRAFWIDEGFTWGVTRLTWPEFAHGLTTRAADMALYYFLAKLWSALGTSEWSFRSLSVIFSIGTIPVVAEIGKRLYSRRGGIIAAALLTVHVFAVYYAREARSYSLVLFLVALSWLQLTNLVRNWSGRNWFLFCLISVLEVYAHFVAGFNIAAQLISILFLAPGRERFRQAFFASLAILAGLTPAFLYVFTHSQGLEWIKTPTTSVIWEFLDLVAGRTGSQVQVLGVALLFLAMVGTLYFEARKFGTGHRLWAASVPVIGAGVPVFGLLAISFYRPTFVPRYLIYTLVPVLLGVGALCARLKPRYALPAAAILVALVARALPAYYREPSFHDFRGAVQYIGVRQQPGDALVIFEPMATPAMQYYLQRLPGSPVLLFPKIGARFQPEDMLQLPDPYTFPSLVDRYNHVWMVYKSDRPPEFYHETPALYLQRMIARNHKLISKHQFRNVYLEEYGR